MERYRSHHLRAVFAELRLPPLVHRHALLSLILHFSPPCNPASRSRSGETLGGRDARDTRRWRRDVDLVQIWQGGGSQAEDDQEGGGTRKGTTREEDTVGSDFGIGLGREPGPCMPSTASLPCQHGPPRQR